MIRTIARNTLLAAALIVAAAGGSISRAAELSPAVSKITGTPAEGKALVVFFRPAKFAGAAVGYKVREGDKALGKLRSGNYFTVNAEPGAHVYTVHSEAKDVLNLETEAGETYFISSSISMGLLVGHPNLSPSNVADFEKVMAKLKMSKPLDKSDDKDEDKSEK